MMIDIISPEKTLFSGEVQSAVFPGKDGSFGVLNNHAPLVSVLKKGVIKITDTAHRQAQFEINGGVVEVRNNKIIVLVESYQEP